MKSKLLIIFLFCIVATNVFADEYYVDSFLGDDQNSGKSLEDPWKTLSKVSVFNFLPGDIINLKRGSVWEEELVISSSGSEGLPIVYRGYGESDVRPLIKLSNEFHNWELAIDESGKKIWLGKIPGVKNSWGAVRSGKRLLKYLEYKTSSAWSAPDSIGSMENGFFYAPLNSWKFYLRYDGGDPGGVEVGSRQYGIRIENKKFILIDGIDVYGPGGNAESGSASSSHQIYISSANNITIKNSSVKSSFTKSIFLCNGSSNCVIENIKCSDQGSTGIYLYQAGSYNVILGCEVFDTGSIKTDFGDMGCIGFESSGTYNSVEKCYAHDNGYLNVNHIDAAISIFDTPKTNISKCYVKNSADKAIMLSENSDESIIEYCIIDNWGVHGDTITAWPSVDGIRLGGGGGGIIGCKVYNNLFINGSKTKGDYGALRIQYRNNKNTKIKNNIFYDVKNVYDIKAESKDRFEGWEISNNLIYRNGGYSIYWGGKKYSIDKIVGNETGYFTNDTKLGQQTIISNPLLLKDNSGLQKMSPCIDNGVYVGIDKDFDGNNVPEGNSVDIGPFEFSTESISAPQNITIEK
ncbi:right-handed parallel beta-helix repeat-containing protein [Desulfoplanes sp.]